MLETTPTARLEKSSSRKILELHGDAGESSLEYLCSIYSKLDSSIGLNTGAGGFVGALGHESQKELIRNGYT